MNFRSWIRRLKGHVGAPKGRTGPPQQTRPRTRFQAELLEDRAVPAAFSALGSALQIDLATNETVGVTTTGSSYQFALTGGTWSGTNGLGVSGSGTATLTATAGAFASVRIDDTGTNDKVTFNN